MVLSTGMTVFAAETTTEAGNVYYYRTCVWDDGSIYPENRSEIEYVACNCY